jgi:hypothetical protein
MEGQVADLYTEKLLSAVHTHKHLDGLGASDLDALLDVERQRDLVGCDDVACIAEVTGALEIDYLLRSSIGRVGPEFVVHLTLIARESAKAVARSEQTYTSDSEMLNGVPSLLLNLLSQ